MEAAVELATADGAKAAAPVVVGDARSLYIEQLRREAAGECTPQLRCSRGLAESLRLCQCILRFLTWK